MASSRRLQNSVPIKIIIRQPPECGFSRDKKNEHEVFAPRARRRRKPENPVSVAFFITQLVGQRLPSRKLFPSGGERQLGYLPIRGVVELSL